MITVVSQMTLNRIDAYEEQEYKRILDTVEAEDGLVQMRTLRQRTLRQWMYAL